MLSVGEVLNFDFTLSNLGGYYQADNGVFICPYSGTYAFSVNILNVKWQLAAADFYIDGTRYVGVWCQDDNRHSEASTMFVGSCSAGGQVYVQAEWGESSVRGDSLSAFAGFLLQRYD